MRTPGLEYHPQPRVGPLSAGVPAPQCCLHEEKRAPKCSQAPQVETAKATVPRHTSVCTFLGSTDTQKHWRSPSRSTRGSAKWHPVFLRWQHEECMRELYQEHTKHMARADLQSEPGLVSPTSQPSKGCSHRQAWAKPQGQSQPSDQEKITQQGEQGQVGHLPGVAKVEAPPEPLNLMTKQVPVTLL